MNYCFHCNWVFAEYEKEYEYNNASYCESCFYLLLVDSD